MHKLIIYLAPMALIVGSYIVHVCCAPGECPICLGIGTVRARWSRHSEHPCGRCGGTGHIS